MSTPIVPTNWQKCHHHFSSIPTSFTTNDHPKYQAWNPFWGLRIHIVYFRTSSELVFTLVDYSNLSIRLKEKVDIEHFESEIHKISENNYVIHTTGVDIILNLLKHENFRLVIIKRDYNHSDFNFRMCKSCQKLKYGANNFENSEINANSHLNDLRNDLIATIKDTSNDLITKRGVTMLIKNEGNVFSSFCDNGLESYKIKTSEGKSIELDRSRGLYKEKCGPFFIGYSKLIHSKTFEQYKGSLLLNCLKFYSKTSSKIICVNLDYFKVMVRVFRMNQEKARFALIKTMYPDNIMKDVEHFYYLDEDLQRLFYLSFDGSVFDSVEV